MIVTMIACWRSVSVNVSDRADQFRPVVGGNEADAVGQVKRGNLGVECADDLQCIRADPHHHDPADRLPCR